MYSIIRVPDGANCLRCQKKLLHVCSTSTHLKHHPPHHHVACKRNIFRPHVPCSPPSDSFKESISSSANLLKVKNSRKFAIPIFDLDKYKVWGRNGYFGKCSVCPFKVMPLLEEMFSHPRQTLSSDHRQITITTHLTCLPISSLSSLFRRPPFC